MNSWTIILYFFFFASSSLDSCSHLKFLLANMDVGFAALIIPLSQIKYWVFFFGITLQKSKSALSFSSSQFKCNF